MSSTVLKFLSLAIICAVMIDGGVCHEDRKRPTTNTVSGTTDTGGLSTDLMVTLGVGIVTLAVIILVSCCTKKHCNNQLQDAQRSNDTVLPHALDSKVMGDVSSQLYSKGESAEDRSRNKGPQMLTVTQQTPASPRGEAKKQISQPPHPLTIPNHPIPPLPFLKPTVVHSVTSFSAHLSPQTRSAPLPPQGVVSTLHVPSPLPPQGLASTYHIPAPPSPQGLVPTLRDLCLLPVPNWYLLGLQLGVSADELDVIERNYPRDNHTCKAKMFGAWLRMDTSATYERLAKALVTVGKRNIAEAMCTARGIQLTILDNVPVTTVDPLPPTLTLPPDPSECVARYAQYLKDKYKRMPTLPNDDWPPSLGRQYTRLAMIERERELPGAELVATMERDYIYGNIDNIVKRKRAIQLPEVFLPTEDGGQQLKILMDGAPGVGKSTLSRKVCKDWASGELLKQYHLVILLPLRQTSIREATSIEDLIDADDTDLKQQVVRHIQETSGEHVLFILDGYDELSNEDRTQKSVFIDIVQGKKFLKCSVLVTSRPYASDYLQCLESINRHVEVLGFTKEWIEHCIMAHKHIPDKFKTELVQMLKERQDIASLCYIPLNCAIVLYVYNMERYTLPHSLTTLYETFILNALKRHANIVGSDPRSTRRLNTLKKLPEALQQQLSALSKLAYGGLVADKMVFSIDDLKAAFSDCSDFEIECSLLGLMTVFSWFTSTGEEVSYQFLHLTIQEFLAARWSASQLSADELLKFFQDHLREKRYRMVLLFLAGISQLRFPFADNLFRGKLDFKESICTKIEYFLFLCHLIYESQNFSLFHNLASAIVGAKLSVALFSISTFDSLVLAHFLVWCDHPLKLLDLYNCDLTSQFLEILHRVNLEHHGATQIEEVDLSNNPKIITKLSLLPAIPVFEHTKVLKACELEYPEGVSCCQVDFLCLMNMRHLTNLKISVEEVSGSDSGIYLLSNKFQCQNGNFDIFRSLEHVTTLEELDLLENSKIAHDQNETVGSAVMKMLNSNRILKLKLSGCGLTCEVAAYFANGLAQNYSLKKMVLSSNQIGSAGAVSIFRSLEHNTSLEVLDLSLNSQLAEGDSEAVGFAIERMLNVNRTIKVLNLRDCGLDTVVATHVFRSLEHNTSLKELDLSGNSQLGEGDSEAVGCVIEKMLNMNRTIKVLNLSGCQVTDSIAKYILAGMIKNTSLVTLDIGLSKLSGSCAVSLFQQTILSITVGVLGVGEVKINKGNTWCVMGHVIPAHCVEFFRAVNDSGMKIPKLNVQGLTDQTAKHFAVGLAESQSVQALVLYHKVSSTGAVSIFKSLEHNTSLEGLDLSDNSQLAEGDSEGVGCAIERMLNVNRTLKVLNLRGCRLANEVVVYLTNGLAHNYSVRKVVLSSNQIGSTGAVSIFKLLQHNTSLEEVDLSGNSQLAKGESEVVSCAIEKMLDLNKTLKVLNLCDCGIDTVVGTHIFRSLQHNTSLEKLDLSENRQLAEGDSVAVGCAIEGMLNVNATLKVLNLNVCQVADPIANHILTGLMTNTSLLTLDIRSSRLSSSCAVSLLQCVTHHPTLNTVGEVNVLGVGMVKMDRGAICYVASDIIPEHCNEFFRALNDSDLKVSKLKVRDLTDQTTEHLTIVLARSLPVLTLDLSCESYKKSYIRSTGAVNIFRSLEHNTSLKELNLSGNWQLAEGDSDAVGCAIERMLKVNTTLKIFNLSGCQVIDPIVKHVVSGLVKNTSVVKLDIGSCKLSISYAVCILQQVTTCPSLSRLSIGEMHVLGVGRVLLDRRAATVSLLYSAGAVIPENCVEFMRAINHTGMVSKLNVRNIRDQRAEHSIDLAEKLSVQILDLKHNTIGSTVAVSIFRSVEHNTSLDKLDLSWNWQLAKGDSEAVGCAIERMLNMNKTLKVLNLGGCGLDTAVVTHIAAGLAQNVSLTELNIADIIVSVPRNNITSEGWVHVFKAIHSSTSLKKLEINHNKLEMEESVALAEMLSYNKSLTELNLRGCDVPESGLREIAKALLCNMSLTKLNISRNKLGVKGAVALAEILSCNTSLTELNLRGCDIPEAGLAEIARGLLQNTTMQTLKLLNPHYKTFLEAEIERLKRSEIISPET